MNIFYIHPDAATCAIQHTDRHTVKMIVEYAQLLSTAHRILDGTEIIGVSKTGRKQKQYFLDDPRNEGLYKASHINHPSNRWVRHSSGNYHWLYSLWTALLSEYTYRYGKRHSCERLIPYLDITPKNIPYGEFSPPWRAMPDEYKVDKSHPDYCVESYRAYYNGAKKHIHKWKNRPTPDWIV